MSFHSGQSSDLSRPKGLSIVQMQISGETAYLVAKQQKSPNVRGIELVLTTLLAFQWLIKHCTGLIKTKYFYIIRKWQ